MIGFSTICCFPVDIAVRLIGSISLLMNVLVFIALVSNPGEVLADDKIRIIFGFDSEYFNPDNQSRDDAGPEVADGTMADLFTSQPCLPYHVIDSTVISRGARCQRVGHSPNFALFYFTLIVAISHYLWWIQSKQQSTESPDQELRESLPKSTYFNRQLVEAPSLMSI
ncbi:hypothetical protein RUM43_003412 [Polyplax serrata]|uniref:Transmembrane protein n=1 Tax=Polyplax serrata TaxID=468196 RepID=A0AAN8NWN3_POLSC